MAENSAIEWTTHTFNPWVGCTKISPACDHCYAESWAKRTGGAALWQGERRRTTASNWRQPLKWNAEAERAGVRARVFCASLADVFDNQVPEEWRRDLFDLIRVTPHLDWQLLTKRPQNIAKMLPPDWDAGWPNVWLGTTVANQEEADRNIPHLLRVPAAKRFLSCEPLLGPINLRTIDVSGDEEVLPLGAAWLDRLEVGEGEGTRIDWVIVGGESGPGARPMHPDWASGLRDQCQIAGVPFFFKQWGGWTVTYDRDLDDPDWRRPPRHGDRRGRYLNLAGGHGFHGERVLFVEPIGKKAAGALLDGREWREMPA